MDPGSHLKGLLQTQLASDASATRHLPYCLSTLTAESLLPSSHLTKWTTRIHALLHSRESGARWAGLCLAYKTANLSRTLMLDAAQSWITVVLPMLLRNEPIPTLKAAVRLIRFVLISAIDMPEFYRQVCIPNVVKFTSSVVSLAENNTDIELCTACLNTLTQLVSLYPTTHRASSTSLFALSLRYLNGSLAGSTDKGMRVAASRLYAVLPLIGGKVGAINLWRKSVDEIVAFGWEAFHCLRTTFPIAKGFDRPRLSNDPTVAVPLNLDRLRCCITTLQILLSTSIQRPVQVPIGNLIKFVFGLLSCSVEEKNEGFVDPSIRGMEVAIVPHIWRLGCALLTDLAKHFPSHLNPHSGQLLSVLAFHLDQKPNSHQQLNILKATETLLRHCYPSNSPALPSRLAKAVLPLPTKLLSLPLGRNAGQGETSSSKEKNGKKRARHYEGDEVFKTSTRCLFSTAEERENLLLSMEVIRLLFKNPNMSPALQSVIGRTFISILLLLPRLPASLLSDDTSFLEMVRNKVRSFTLVISSGTTSVMGKALPFAVQEAIISCSLETQSDIGLLLHPRVPPLVRSMPHVESLSLWKVEESQEEAEIISSLMASTPRGADATILQDVVMKDDPVQTTSPPEAHETLISTVPAVPDAPLTEAALLGPEPVAVDNLQCDAPSRLSLGHENDEQRDAGLHSVQKFTTVINAETEPAGVSQMTPVVFALQNEEDENEEMPEINMESDSEAE